MAFNGAGVFSRLYSWVTDAANGLNVSSTRTDADTNDIANGLTNCMTKDGQSTPTANIGLGGFKLVNIGTGTATTDAVRVDQANSQVNEFRLTLTSGLPVTTADINTATTVYCTPYKGNHIALYDGAAWHMRTSVEFSLALGTLTSGKPYDVFCYDNSGVPTLEFLVWTNDTTRATALAYQDGVLSKTGALTRRYMGTFYTISTTQTCDSSSAGRYLFNYYNRARRSLNSAASGSSWTYTTATIRQANGSAVNQVAYIAGVCEDAVEAEIITSASNTAANVEVFVGVGIDSTTTFNLNLSGFAKVTTQVINLPITLVTHYRGFPGVGRHFLSWNEWSAATGTTTWAAVSTPAGGNGGIVGMVWA